MCHDPDVTRNQSAIGPDSAVNEVRVELPESRGEKVLTVDGVSCTFSVRRGLFGKRKPLKALDNVSLDIRKGEVLALVGNPGVARLPCRAPLWVCKSLIAVL